jgi:hypothetical protein
MANSEALGDRNVVVTFLETYEPCPTCHRIGALEPLSFSDSKSQAFFAELAAEITKPSVGDIYRDHVRIILRRAAERGLYESGRA